MNQRKNMNDKIHKGKRQYYPLWRDERTDGDLFKIKFAIVLFNLSIFKVVRFFVSSLGLR